MRKYFVTVLACAATTFSAFGQNDNIAFAGVHAVFVFQGFLPASPQFPGAAGNTGFTLQRRENASQPWATVSSFHSPQNLDEVIAGYNESINVLPDARRVTFNAVEAWDKWLKYKRFDSMVNEVGYAPGQMAFGILVADTTVQAGKTYQYRVVKNVISTAADSSFVSNAVAYPAKLEIPVPKFLHRQAERDAIMITWFARGFKTIDNFNVYRAGSNDKAFTKIAPGIRVVQHQDSTLYTLLDNNVSFSELYRYYIEPVNGFSGGGNIISDTVPATCMNPQQLQTPQDIYTTADLKRKAVVLNYGLPDQGFIGTVHVFRSRHFDSGYAEVAVNGPADTSFVDYHVRPGVKYYYYLLMTDKMGRNSPRSIKTFGLFQDTANEQTPRFVTAENVDKGIKISWQNPPIKQELSGYYVYRSAGGVSNFQRITTLLPVQDSINTYTDTTKILTPGMLYSYCIKSESLSNVLSNNSSPAYIKADNTMAVAEVFTPRNFKAMIDQHSARLFWNDMRALNNNLAYYRISRKVKDAAAFAVLEGKYSAEYFSYLDSTIVPGQSYEYAIESIDDGGHTSAQATSNIIGTRQEMLPAPVISLFKTTDGVSIAWQDVVDARIHSYNIYRYTKGSNPEKIGSAGVKAGSFVDKNAIGQKTYFYYIEADTENRPVKAIASNRVYAVSATDGN